MATRKKKMTAEEAVRFFDEEFRRQQERDREIHENVMKGFVIHIIEQGLLDDVESPEES